MKTTWEDVKTLDMQLECRIYINNQKELAKILDKRSKSIGDFLHILVSKPKIAFIFFLSMESAPIQH